MCSTRLVVSRTTPDRSVRSGRSSVMWADSRLYTELLVSFFGRLDSTYFSCCLRKIAFFSNSWTFFNDVSAASISFTALWTEEKGAFNGVIAFPFIKLYSLYHTYPMAYSIS